MAIKTGLENFLENPPDYIKGKRLGILCNQASVNSRLVHCADLINQRFPKQLKALYSPQHGFFGEKQDNMIESDNILHPVFKIPVFSLYGKTRIPDKRMLDPVDILIIDIQDAGTRVYTFIYTMSFCLEKAKEMEKKVVILDRPNPVNGITIEGNILKKEFTSFVGRYPIPMRHGLTIGELALLFNDHFKINCDLDIIRMNGWIREMYFKQTGLNWVAPSPNLPTPASAIVYPGQVLWEGTNISEARGTTAPFEMFGAPFINPDKVLSGIKGKISGAVLRKVAFEPVANKWQGNLCHGFQIHITDIHQYKPYLTTLKLIRSILIHHKKEFQWKNPPYEYEFSKLPIDLITGDKTIRIKLEHFHNIKEIAESWKPDLNEFEKIRQEFFLYK